MPRKKKEDRMITLIKAAELPEVKQLDVTPGAIRTAIKRKKLAGEKRGRDWFVWEQDVIYWAKHNVHLTGRPRKTKLGT